MSYRLSADFILVVHFCFVLFIVFGGLLVVRRRRLAWLHLPAVLWGIAIEFFQWTCPLTATENYLRQLGGESGYQNGFIDYFVSLILYSPLSSNVRFALGLLLLTFNVVIYRLAFRRTKIV